MTDVLMMTSFLSVTFAVLVFLFAAPMILTIPSRRPVKAVYIRKLVAFVDAYGEPA
jgi:hypothetical protein